MKKLSLNKTLLLEESTLGMGSPLDVRFLMMVVLKTVLGGEDRAASAVGLGFTLQWGWNSSYSPEMSGMNFLVVELQLILQPQWPQGAQPQQTQSTRQQPSRKPHRGSKIQFKQPLSIQGCLSWDN